MGVFSLHQIAILLRLVPIALVKVKTALFEYHMITRPMGHMINHKTDSKNKKDQL